MRGCPRRLLAVSLTACSAVLAGCGSTSGPKIAHADAAVLISLAHRIAGERACAQARDIPRLRARVIAYVNAGSVPQPLQEPLMSAVGALGAEQPLCLPAVPTAVPSPAPAPAPRKHRDHGRHGRKHDR